MTPGTSPHPGTRLSSAWTDAWKHLFEAAGDLRVRLPRLRPDGTRLARGAATLYLGGLVIILTTAWQGAAAAGAVAASLPAWHLAFLMATGAAAAMLTLTGGGRDDPGQQRASAEPGQPTSLDALMAQMSHELRTPLNAVIGFSEVMRHELHGPLGNARYQEYASHISESGGRLLRSSEQALAVTEAMTALMADRAPGRRERLLAGSMLREAWRTAAGDGSDVALSLNTCATCDILCERRPTAQALEHLLREALTHATPGTAVEVTGRRRGGSRSLTLRVASPAEPAGTSQVREAAGTALGILLARLLLEAQGATLTCTSDPQAGWSAVVSFPAGR